MSLFETTDPLTVRSCKGAGAPEARRRASFLHIDRVNDSEGREALRAELLEWLEARLQGADAPPKGVKIFAHEASGDPAELIAQLATDLTASVVAVRSPR